MKTCVRLLLTTLLLNLFLIDIDAQRERRRSQPEPPPEPAANDTVPKKPEADKGKIKAFGDVIKGDFHVSEGLFTVYKVDDKYYFEVRDTLLEREILVVSRISGHVRNLNFGGAGMKSRPQQVMRWQKHDNQLLLRSVSYHSVASEDDPVYQSVRNNNFEPVIYTFKIEAYNKDTTGYIVDVMKFFTTDVEMIGPLTDAQRRSFEISSLDADRSYVVSMRSFPLNTEVRHVLTYRGKKLPDNAITGTLSVEMNQSMILLPDDPWMPRLHDARVGYFSVRQIDYSLDEQKAAARRFITRWRLEPSDPEAYARGEIVDPVKPIEYYIDPATPLKWRNALKQGIEDWQVAFEAAGFKNAIVAKDPPSPEEDPDWSPEDVRYSVIRYITTEIQNAQGPHVHDPRTGQIIESDILWYHNVMNLLRNWFFVQTAAVNPEARAVKFDDEIMSELIRFVAAHEVGHTLGLPHNMGSSSAYPVDSLRSPTFTANHGTAPSIMDYARFNYIAQPGDGVTNFYPRVGEYDIWSIMYGYRLNPGIATPEDDHQILHQWILERADDPAYRFGRQRAPVDPSAQTEDLGDDAVYASNLGIENLKRIVPNLIEWTSEEGRPFDNLQELYNNVIAQLRRYVGHVVTNIGGVYEIYKTTDQDEAIYSRVPAGRQRQALEFVNRQVFTTPEWLLEEAILGRIEEAGALDRIREFQDQAMNLIFQAERLYRVYEGETLDPQTLGLAEVFNTVSAAIWSELDANRPINAYRRNLQRAHIEQMKRLLELEEKKYDQTDIKALARHTLRRIQARTAGASGGAIRAIHLADINARVTKILEDQGGRG